MWAIVRAGLRLLASPRYQNRALHSHTHTTDTRSSNATLQFDARYGMHVVVGNELHSRYDKVDLVLPGGDERRIKKARGVAVR